MDLRTALEKHYDAVAEEYAPVNQGTGFVLEKLRAKEGAFILDIGCGTGNLTFRLAEKVRLGRVVGLDISEGVLRVARKHAHDNRLSNFEFVLSDRDDLPFADGEFDAVVSNMALHLFPDKQKAFAEIIRVLRPGGSAVLRFLGGAASAPAWMEVLGQAWVEVMNQPATSNLLYRSLVEDVTSANVVGEWLGGHGIRNFEITWQKATSRITENQLQAAGQMRRLVGDFWKQGIPADQAERIDERIAQRTKLAIQSRGYIEGTANFLLVSFSK